MIKRFEDWIWDIPVPDHIAWMARSRKLESGLTYHQPVRRVGWGIIDGYARKKGWRSKVAGQFVAKFLHIMFRMERLTVGPVA